MAAAVAVWRESAPAAWSELLATDPNAGPAHRPEVWEALAATLPGHQTRFAAVEERGALAGGAAFLLERRGGLHWIHGLPMVLPGTPLARPGLHAWVDEAAALALADLARERRAVGGEWSLYRPLGPAFAPAALEPLGGERLGLESAVIDLGEGIEAAWRRVDRKARQEIRAARAHGLAFAEDPSALEAGYALHAAQTRRWGRTPLPLALARRLLAAGGEPPCARLFVVADREGLVSAALALDGARETLVWWSGTHPEGRRRHAFPLLLWSIAEWAARAGRARLNLGASPGLDPVASFKRSLGARVLPYPVCWLDARHASSLGRWVAGLQRLRRRGRARGSAA